MHVVDDDLRQDQIGALARTPARGAKVWEATVLLLDGRSLMRDCLARALAGEWSTARILAAGWERLNGGFSEAVDVCVASLDAGDGEGSIEQLARIRRALPETTIVVLSAERSVASVSRAAALGARGYFSTSDDLKVLVQGIRLVLVGGTALPVAVPSAAAAEAEMPAAPAREIEPRSGRFSVDLFTPKETDVLRCLANGKPNKIIAYELSICETTVKVHLRHIFKKIGATNRTHAALIAREMLGGES